MNMEDMAVHEAFDALKSLCDRLARNPEIQNVKALENSIKRRSDTVIQYNLEYLLFPIYVHLHNERLCKDTKRQLVELLRTILSKTRITNLNYFIKFYTALLMQIYDGDQQNMLIQTHEELKESTVKCLNDLIKSSSMDIIDSLYVRQNAAKLSQGVYTCLSIAKTEQLWSLRFAAIEALMALMQVHDNADPNDVVQRARVADIAMLFLPGVAHGLCQVALGNDLQNHKVTKMAIKAFGRIITLVMEDKIQEETAYIESALTDPSNEKSVDPLGISQKLEGDEGMKKHIETAERSKEWIDAASSKLNTLIRSLINLVRHSHSQIRKQLLLSVELILSKCSRNMRTNFVDLIEILISLSEDEAEEVRNDARQILNQISENFSENYNMRPVVEMLEENLYKLLTGLPRLMRRSDDSVQLSYLNQLAGYIRLLGKRRLPHVMASVSHLRRLLLALVYVAELDCSHVSILEDVQIKDIEDRRSTRGSSHSWKRFKFIRETWTEEKLISVCKLLGEFGDLALLIDNIFELMGEMPQYRRELTLLLNWISTVPVEDSSMLILHKQIIDFYTEPDNWYLPIQVCEDVSLGDAQRNIVHCCLLTEGLGNIATNLGERFQKYLLKTMYLVIERSGSGNDLISQAGLTSLEKIAHSQNYENIEQLLRDNVDYVSYHVTVKIRRVERNPGVLDVFAIVIKYSTMDVLPCLKEIVQDALAQLSHNFHEQNSYALLKILYLFVICIRKLNKSAETSQNEKSEIEEISNRAEIVVQSLIAYHNAKEESRCIEDDIVESPEDIGEKMINEISDELPSSAYDDQQEEQTVEPPHYIKMTEDVTKCCLNFLPSKQVQMSLMAMQILEEGLEILSKWSEQLLPLVHQMWHPLVDRFNDTNILVINRAWQLLDKLANVSQDFIRSRTLKQVLPSLSKFLVKSAKESYNKNLKDAYKFTQIFKLQKLLLTQAGTVAKNLKLHERQLWQLLDITQCYLSAHQHAELRDCCVQLFKDVAGCNADIVWVKCLAIWNGHVAEISRDGNLRLDNLRAGSLDTRNEYRMSLEDILYYIENMTDDV